MLDASLPDLLRLLAVPVFGWIALRDYRTRRVPGKIWYPLLGLGAVALVWDVVIVLDEPFALRRVLLWTAVSVGLLVPVAYLFRRFGAFGGADAKAIAVIAVLFPTYPTFEVLGTLLPVIVPNLPVFSLSILVDAMLVGALYPAALAVRNAAAGHHSVAMFVGVPASPDALLTTHGKLLETTEGFTLSGLDLDALRMYLRWRDLALQDLREHPEVFRRPSTIPGNPSPPTDGAVDPDVDPEPGGAPAASFGGDRQNDTWGAATFLDSIEGSAYGTTPETLRAGLDLLVERERVWLSPGIPFLVPLFGGIVIALTVGDILFVVLSVLGIV